MSLWQDRLVQLWMKSFLLRSGSERQQGERSITATSQILAVVRRCHLHIATARCLQHSRDVTVTLTKQALGTAQHMPMV